MIRLTRITSFQRRTGVLSILIFTLIPLCNTQAQTLDISDLRTLGIKFKEQNEHFLSYVFNLSVYYLSADSSLKLAAGMDALKSALQNKRYIESRRLISDLSISYPSLSKGLQYYYGYNSILASRFDEGADYLAHIENPEGLRDRIHFLLAYGKLNMNQPGESLLNLNSIGNDFAYFKDVQNIKHNLEKGPSFVRKRKVVALPLSACIPGAGQLYNGFVFDAIQSFGFNLVLGGACYATWRYEMAQEKSDRNYILPIISTGAWSIFYLVNFYSAWNSTDRANLYHEGRFYRSVSDDYQAVLRTGDFFLNGSIPESWW